MKPVTMLVLDDEENILKSIARTFLQDTFAVATTMDPQEALKIIAKEPIKVIISDQRMPTTTGVEFLRKAKEIKPDAVRILFTGYSDITAVEQAINLGEIYRYINKPCNMADLRNTVHQAIDRYDLVLENRRLFEETQLKNCELQAANEVLKILFDRQREFTSTVSHELRTPLSSIKTAIEIILSQSTGPLTAEQQEFLGHAGNNVDRLARLINDILDLTKLEEGRSPLNMQPVDINAVIKDTVVLQQEVAKKKGLGIEVKLDPAVIQVDCDIDKINQMLNNLITNAIRYTQEGKVIISTQLIKEDNNISIIVADTGCGISPEDTAKLFQKFQQLGDPARRQSGGTGLGLAICKEIVKQHGGKIWVESTLGKGSSFHVTLPIK